MAFTTEVFLYQASRAQLYREIVLPSLAAGKVVVMDRTRDSSSVYQGMVRGFGLELIEQLNDISTEKTKPDLTFLLDVPVGVGLGRKKEQEEINRLEMEKKDFHRKVRKAYLELAKKDKKRWWVIDGTLSIDEVEKRIWRRMKKELDRS